MWIYTKSGIEGRRNVWQSEINEEVKAQLRIKALGSISA
jgi:hypothetical protein